MTVVPFPSRQQSDDGQSSIASDGYDQIPGANASHTHLDDTRSDDFEGQVEDQEWHEDAVILGTNALREKYPRSFSSFNAMKQRAQRGEAAVHPEFASFKSFFGHMGPRRSPALTLDRMDHTNPMYGPGLCEWAGKKAQARNRKTTKFIRDPRTGQLIALVALAEERGVPPSRLRRQKKDGWTDEEIFAGQRMSSQSATVALGDRWPWELEPRQVAWWEEQYLNHRRPATETGYEYRYEFALRWLRELQETNIEFLGEAWDRYGSPADDAGPASDGSDQMPLDYLQKYERAIDFRDRAERRMSEARDGEAAWRKNVSDRLRPRIPKDERY